MKCPHCLVEINPNFSETFLNEDKESFWSVFTMNCPNPHCGKMIIDLASGEPYRNQQNKAYGGLRTIKFRQTVRPFASSRPPVPPEVEETNALTYPILEQNNPNPFNTSTIIGYYLPNSITSASIFIYDMNGVQLKSYLINVRGKGNITIQGSEFNAGMYLYALIADGKVIDTKRMILTK